MRNVLTSLLGLALAIAPAACGGKKTDNGTGSGSAAAGSGSATTTTTTTTTTPTAGSGSAGSAAAGSGSGSGSATTIAGSGSGSGSAGSADAGSGAGSGSDTSMAHHAGMCPSTVLGATTKDELKAGKIIVTISATDKDAIVAIQKRAAELLKEKTDNTAAGSTTSGHDQKGTHGGGMGLCPVFVPEGATATAKDDAKGVVVTITPSAKDKPADFKAIVDARITKSADWVKANIKAGDQGNEGGVGGGKGSDGSNHSGKGDGKGKDRKDGSGAGSAKK